MSSSLEERVLNPPSKGDFAAPWEWYEVGEDDLPILLTGEVEGVDTRTNDDGESYPIVTVKSEDDGRVAFHAMHTTARAKLENLDPKPGDEIAIAYHGRKKTQDGKRSYHHFEIAVEEGEA